MAHNELPLASNIIDVAFSKSGTKIAVLMRDSFSIFSWPLKRRPVASPHLEVTCPLLESTISRPTQIAFLGEGDVFVLRNARARQSTIEMTNLESRLSTVLYRATETEQLLSIFADLGYERIWFSHALQARSPVKYSSIERQSGGDFQINAFQDGPEVDTHWAKAVRISEDKVSAHTSPIYL